MGNQKSCADLHGPPPQPTFCANGQECDPIAGCPGPEKELRNVSTYFDKVTEAKETLFPLFGVEGTLTTRICTATQDCVCHTEPFDGKDYCGLGGSTTQDNLTVLVYGTIPPNGGQECIGSVLQ
ncbi:MAG: hypothetical protein AB8B50_15275 [Pirellulaceae bacterium]